MLKKLVVVYNAMSSHHAAVESEVLDAVRQLKGWMVAKYPIKPTSYDDNVLQLAKLLDDGDLVIVAGGDGTATITINGILRSRKDVTVGVLGYGNFNDISHTLGITKPINVDGQGVGGVMEIMQKYETNEIVKLYPLEVWLNGELWRYAPCYLSLGLIARSTEVLEEKKVREELDTGKHGPSYSLRNAIRWYLKKSHRGVLPEGELNGAKYGKGTTDYFAVNGPVMAQIMKGGDFWREEEVFGSCLQTLGKFWKMVKFGLTAINSGVPLTETRRDIITFDQLSDVEIQTEGEFERLKGIKTIEIKKGGQFVKVVTKQVK